MASFFQSDEHWGRGREIPLMDMGMDDGGTPYPSMRTTAVEAMVSATNDRMVYVYDFLRMWCFYVEVIGMEEGETPEYPLLAEGIPGEAPDQFSKEVDLGDGPTEPATEDDGPLKTGDPELDAYLAGDEDEEEDGPSFTSLDDLDDLAFLTDTPPLQSRQGDSRCSSPSWDRRPSEKPAWPSGLQRTSALKSCLRTAGNSTGKSPSERPNQPLKNGPGLPTILWTSSPSMTSTARAVSNRMRRGG